MSVDDPSEMTSLASRRRPNGGFLGPLRAVALSAVVVGSGGSVGLMLRGGHPPLFLRVLFTIWVLSPFMALLLANRVSKRWSARTRASLYGVMLAVTLGSLAIYGHAVLSSPRSRPTPVFVVVPPVSWLLIAIVVPLASRISGGLSRRGDGA